jgi:hypothetical protein
MDFFQSHQTVAKPLLSYLLPFSRTFNCTSKTGWFTKGLKLIPTCYANKVLLKVAHILIYIDGLLSVAQTVPQVCYLTFFHFPERSIALVKRLAGSKGAEIDPNLPANKVLLQGSTRILIYIDGLLSVAPNCAQGCYLTFFHFPERSIALVKRLAGSPKG